MSYVAEALKSLKPGCLWEVIGEKVIWHDTDNEPPTEEELVEKVAELKYDSEVKVYRELRAIDYPPVKEQLDKIFHEGVDAWKAEIQAIKDAHPKAEMDPSELENRKANALFEHRLEKYKNAIERISQYRLADGREEIVEETIESDLDDIEYDEDGNPIPIKKIIQTLIEPLPATITVLEYTDLDGYEGNSNIVEKEVPNPAIVEDDEERATAQSVIDNTPQEVIDYYQASL